MTIGIVSGYFNPLHQGHIEYFNGAKEQCDHLVVIVNNDNQVFIKGSTPFMDENHRAFIVENLKSVNEVMISIDKDRTVCESIRSVWSNFPCTKMKFFNSGDRVNNAESKETELCKMLGIEYVNLPLPKKFSSSELVQTAALEV